MLANSFFIPIEISIFSTVILEIVSIQSVVLEYYCKYKRIPFLLVSGYLQRAMIAVLYTPLGWYNYFNYLKLITT